MDHSQWTTQEQLVRSNEKQFRGGLVFKARRLLHQSTLGSRAIKKKKKKDSVREGVHRKKAEDGSHDAAHHKVSPKALAVLLPHQLAH